MDESSLAADFVLDGSSIPDPSVPGIVSQGPGITAALDLSSLAHPPAPTDAAVEASAAAAAVAAAEVLGGGSIDIPLLPTGAAAAAASAAPLAPASAPAAAAAPAADAAADSGSHPPHLSPSTAPNLIAPRKGRRKWTMFRGVAFDKQKNKWEAKINDEANSKRRRLGRYESMEEAAQAYDRAKLLVDGPESELNFPADNYPEELQQYSAKAALAASTQPNGKGPAPAKRPRIPGKVSQYRGVTWDKEREQWEARLYIPAGGPDQKRKKRRLGRFESEEEAARSYDRARVLQDGESEGLLNFSIVDYAEELLEYDQRAGLRPTSAEAPANVKTRPKKLAKKRQQPQPSSAGKSIKPAVANLVTQFLKQSSGRSGLPLAVQDKKHPVLNLETEPKEATEAAAAAVESFRRDAAEKFKGPLDAAALRGLPDCGLSAFIASKGGQEWTKTLAWNFLKFPEPGDKLLTAEDLAAIIKISMWDETLRGQHSETHPSTRVPDGNASSTKVDLAWTTMAPGMLSSQWVQDSNIGEPLMAAGRDIPSGNGIAQEQQHSIFLVPGGSGAGGQDTGRCLFLAVQQHMRVLQPCPKPFASS